MKIHFERLERRSQVNDGTWGTFYNNNNKYSGVVFDTHGDKTYWIFEVKNGMQNGIEKTYHEETNIIEQIAEYKDNFQFGVSKEFDENGNLTNVNILYNNNYLRMVEKIDGDFKEVQSYDNKYGDNLPVYLQRLINLSTQELVDYNFKDDNPYLKID